MEELRQRILELRKKNESLQQKVAKEQETYTERQLRIIQLKSELASKKDELKKYKANIEEAQNGYQEEFEKCKKATAEVHDNMLETINRRAKVVKLISTICDSKTEKISKNLEALDASAFTKILAEQEALKSERKEIVSKCLELRTKMTAFEPASDQQENAIIEPTLDLSG